jgi:predicted SprT family Zn-dependent metalloprotease
MLLGPPHLIYFPETRCSRIPQKQEENVIEHHIAWTIKGSYTAVSYLATALEGRFEGKSDKQPQSGVLEESRIPEVCHLHRLHGS